jgi:hypothetical protein
MTSPAKRALAVGGAISASCLVLHWLGVGLPLLAVLAAVFALLAIAAPRLLVRWFDHSVYLVRAAIWRREHGRHHSFDGVALDVHDDGRHVWLAAADLNRVLRVQEPEDVTAARHSGHWRRDDDGALHLRVDGIVAHLSHRPDRMEPRIIRLRRYLERELLFPAAERRRRH